MLIERLNSENNIKEEQINSLSGLINDHVKDKNDMHGENMKLID